MAYSVLHMGDFAVGWLYGSISEIASVDENLNLPWELVRVTPLWGYVRLRDLREMVYTYLNEHRPDIVVVSAGAQDVDECNSNVCQTHYDLMTLVRWLVRKGVRKVLVSPVHPRGPDQRSPYFVERARMYNGMAQSSLQGTRGCAVLPEVHCAVLDNDLVRGVHLRQGLIEQQARIINAGVMRGVMELQNEEMSWQKAMAW